MKIRFAAITEVMTEGDLRRDPIAIRERG